MYINRKINSNMNQQSNNNANNYNRATINLFTKYFSICFIIFLISLAFSQGKTDMIYSLIGTLVGSGMGAMIAVEGSLCVLNKTNEKSSARDVRMNACIISTELYACLDNIKILYVKIMKNEENLVTNIPIRDNWMENLAKIMEAIGTDDFSFIVNLYQDISYFKIRNENDNDNLKKSLIWFAKKYFKDQLVDLNEDTIKYHVKINQDLNNNIVSLFNRLNQIGETAFRIEKLS